MPSAVYFLHGFRIAHGESKPIWRVGVTNDLDRRKKEHREGMESGDPPKSCKNGVEIHWGEFVAIPFPDEKTAWDTEAIILGRLTQLGLRTGDYMRDMNGGNNHIGKDIFYTNGMTIESMVTHAEEIMMQTRTNGLNPSYPSKSASDRAKLFEEIKRLDSNAINDRARIDELSRKVQDNLTRKEAEELVQRTVREVLASMSFQPVFGTEEATQSSEPMLPPAAKGDKVSASDAIRSAKKTFPKVVPGRRADGRECEGIKWDDIKKLLEYIEETYPDGGCLHTSDIVKGTGLRPRRCTSILLAVAYEPAFLGCIRREGSNHSGQYYSNMAQKPKGPVHEKMF